MLPSHESLWIPCRVFVQTSGTKRLQGSIPVCHRISDAAGSLISPRVQPARYAVAMRFPRPVTRTFVPPLETPATCHVRLAATTSKPWKNFAEYRTRLSSPYILRSTLCPPTPEKHAGCQSGSYEKRPMSCGQSLKEHD